MGQPPIRIGVCGCRGFGRCGAKEEELVGLFLRLLGRRGYIEGGDVVCSLEMEGLRKGRRGVWGCLAGGRRV
jgi:hypothetical protein